VAVNRATIKGMRQPATRGSLGPPVVLVAINDASHYQREILIGLGAAAQQRGWCLESATELVGDGPPAAVMRSAAGVIAYAPTSDAHPARLRLGIPWVELGTALPDIGIDENAVGAQAVTHLAAAGYRRIAMLRGIDQQPGPRCAGVMAAARRVGLEMVDLGVGSGGPDDGQLGDWLVAQSLTEALGVICHNDLMAWRVAGICRQRGLALPGRIGLLGCDDDPLVTALCPLPLSSVAMPHRRLGGEAVELLAALMSGDKRPVSRVLAPSGVVARASTSVRAVADTQVAAACIWIAEHAAHPVGIDAIAAAVGSGRRSLERRFRAALGRSPLEQVHLARLAIAQEALRGGATVHQAAARAGWSVDALTAACRTWLGSTPAELT